MIDLISRLGLLVLFILMVVFIIAIIISVINEDVDSIKCPNPFLCDTCPFPPCTDSEKERMKSEYNQKEILDYLECNYSGAKMNDDVITQLKIARAITAFNADVNIEIFDKKFIEEYSQMYDWSISK